MLSKQQSEAYDYFNKNATEWGMKLKSKLETEVNIIRQRNDYVASLFNPKNKKGNFLDVGCGTGELVVEAASKFKKAVGIDFAESMINSAHKNIEGSRFENIEFIRDSIFDHKFNEKFELISANGFIEYISDDELVEFLRIAFEILDENGLLVLSSRNRLFNLFSLNEYTELEIKHGNVEMLLKESILFSGSKNLSEVLNYDTTKNFIAQDFDYHPYTGIDVKKRFQYTPLQMMNILEKNNFKAEQIFPIHIHGVIPAFKNKYPEAHFYISNFLHNFSENNPALIPNSSSFMICASKRS